MFSERLCQSLFYSLPPFLPHSIPKYLRKLIYLPPDRSSVPLSENSYSTIPPSIPPSISPLACLPHKLLPYITYCVPPSRIQSPFSGLTHLPSATIDPPTIDPPTIDPPTIDPPTIDPLCNYTGVNCREI